MVKKREEDGWHGRRNGHRMMVIHTHCEARKEDGALRARDIHAKMCARCALSEFGPNARTSPCRLLVIIQLQVILTPTLLLRGACLLVAVVKISAPLW